MEGKRNQRIKLKPSALCINSFLFADDLRIMQEKNDIQPAVFQLSQLYKENSRRISTHKTKVMALGLNTFCSAT